MAGILEGVNFSHLVTPFEVYERLVDLDNRIVLRWFIPGKPGEEDFGPPGSTKYLVWVRPKNSTNVKILNGGHLVRFFLDTLNIYIIIMGGVLIRYYRYLMKRHKSWVCCFIYFFLCLFEKR